MNTLNLVNYIRHGMLFSNLAQYELFDLIVYEQYDNAELTPPEGVIFKTILGDKLAIGSGRELETLIQQHNKVLIVLDTMPVDYLYELINSVELERLMIINCHAGITALPAKGKLELSEIDQLVKAGLGVHEPFDFVSLFALLQQDGKHYIRVPDREYPGNLLPSLEELPVAEGILDGTELGLKGDQGTIVCSPSILNEIAQMCSQFETCPYDVFAILDYQFSITQELSDSITKNEQLICIIDQEAESPYFDYIQHKCIEAGCENIDYQFITPQTDHLNKLQSEGLYEQAGFDAIGLADRLQ